MPENTYPPQYERWHEDPGPPLYGPPPQAPKSNKRTLVILGAVLAGLVVLVGCLALIFTSHKGDKPQAQPSQIATATHAPSRAVKAQPPVAKPTAVTVRDGKWEVPGEVKPGTYTTTANADGAGCYWGRLHDFDGGMNSTIANDILAPGAHGRVTIKATDKGIEFSGGCVWAKVK